MSAEPTLGPEPLPSLCRWGREKNPNPYLGTWKSQLSPPSSHLSIAKRAQKTPKTKKSWGAEQIIPNSPSSHALDLGVAGPQAPNHTYHRCPQLATSTRMTPDCITRSQSSRTVAGEPEGATGSSLNSKDKGYHKLVPSSKAKTVRATRESEKEKIFCRMAVWP